MRPCLISLLLLSILSSSSALLVAAELRIDQEYFSEPYHFGAAVGAGRPRAQTFTVGIDGVLERADLQLSRDSRTALSATLELRSTVASGAPDMSPSGLMSWATLDANSIPFEWYTTEFTAFEFGASAKAVTAGQLLALVLTTEAAITPDYWYLWTTSIANAMPTPPMYDRGSNWFFRPGEIVEAVGYSAGFRTFVREIPEPASGLGLAMGMCGLGAIRRRRRLTE